MIALASSKPMHKHLPQYNVQETTTSAQEIVYNFFCNGLKERTPRAIVDGLNTIFVRPQSYNERLANQAFHKIVASEDASLFNYTLKRLFFILLDLLKEKDRIWFPKEFTNFFSNLLAKSKTISNIGYKMRERLALFVKSKDFQEINTFLPLEAYSDQECINFQWFQRYNHYLLIAQSLNLNNPAEQREAAQKRARRLKDRFRFDLAIYIARCQFQGESIARQRRKNPTIFGSRLLDLIKILLIKKMRFGDDKFANLFLRQTQATKYSDFKKSLLGYLMLNVEDPKGGSFIQKRLAQTLTSFQQNHDEYRLNSALILQTCKKIIDTLLKNAQSTFFDASATIPTQTNPLISIRLFVKILLICPAAQTYLESKIASFIEYYSSYPESECQGFINFVEVLNIALAIYTDTVNYSLLEVESERQENDSAVNLKSYRVFVHHQPQRFSGADAV